MTFHQEHWFLKDLQYSYLNDGFKLIATTDVPCHLYARMTTTPPRKHALPSYRRGLALQGDIRFCFVVYEDNEQDEAGDTLTHTWYKSAWPVCETRWFYFVGTISGQPVVSESPIFKFHFPAPPPEPPPPLDAYFYASPVNRTLWFNHVLWPTTHDTINGNIGAWHDPPTLYIVSGDRLTVTYFIFRGFIDFDTSSLPDTARLLSASIQLYATYIGATDIARPWLYITKGVQDLPPVAGDYGAQLPYTDILGQVDLFTLTLNAYNEIPLNAAGLALINPLGKTLFCVRGQKDVEDYTSVPRYDSTIAFHSEQKGAGYRPALHVSYYPA